MSEGKEGPLYFAIIGGWIVTANYDGSIPLSSKVAATFSEREDMSAARRLVKQANAFARASLSHPDTQEG